MGKGYFYWHARMRSRGNVIKLGVNMYIYV
jgi:hypothetical protein